MGAVVYLKQYLSAEGRGAYPALLERHRDLASRADGFIALRSWTPIDPSQATPTVNPGEVELTVEFSTLAKLMAWRASEEHRLVARDYAVYWTRDPELRFYEVSG